MKISEREFLIRFPVYAILLLVAAVMLPDSVYSPVNRLTAGFTSLTLNFFDLSAVARGEYIFTDKLSLWIIPECTPVFMILIFAAFLLSFPASVKEKIEGLISGAAFLITADILRLGVTISLSEIKPSWFSYIHTYIGQVWSVLVVLAACYVWVSGRDNIGTNGSSGRFLITFAVVSVALFIFWVPFNRDYIMAGDKLLKFAFSLFGTRLIFFYQHEVYYHTINLVVFIALIFADSGMMQTAKVRGLLIGLPILISLHLFFRIFNIILYGYGWTAFIPAIKIIHVAMQFLIPLVLWLGLGGGMFLRKRLRMINI